MLYLQETVIVEGNNDCAAVRRAVSALILQTRGLAAIHQDLDLWAPFAAHGGLVILTDPDGPGRRLRDHITARFPQALQAQLPAADCRGPHGRLGVQFAPPEAIRAALTAAGCHRRQAPPTDTLAALIASGLGGGPAGKQGRRRLCTALGIPMASAPHLAAYLNALDLPVRQALKLLDATPL